MNQLSSRDDSSGGKAGLSFRVMIVIGLMLCGSMRMSSSSFDMKTILDPLRTLNTNTKNNKPNPSRSLLSNTNNKHSNITTAINKTGLDEILTQEGSPQVADMMMQENPTNLRVLVAVPMYNLKQYPHFERWLDSLVDLCFCQQMKKLHIVVYTTTVIPIPILQDIEARTTGCQKHLNFSLSVQLRSPSVRLRLVDEHRNMFFEEMNNYDLFIYNEEDINIRPKHIFAYWRETAILHNRLPADQFADYSIGFMRFEEPDTKEFEKTPRIIFEFPWNRTSPEAFAKKHIISKLVPFTGSYYFNAGEIFHQGMYMATASQLKQWKDRGSMANCHFNDTSRSGRYAHREKVSSMNLFNPRGCNVTQLLPVDGYQDFLLHHMANRYISSTRKLYFMPSTELGSMLAAAINTLEDQRKELDEHAKSSLSSDGTGKETLGVNGGTHGSTMTRHKGWIHIHKPEDTMNVQLDEIAYSNYL